MKNSNTARLSNAQRGFVDAHATVLKDLPRPDEKWKQSELPSHVRPLFRKLHSHNLIERTERNTEDGEGKIWLWRTKESLWGTLDSIGGEEEKEDTMPCDHIAFKNLRGCDLVKCKRCGDEHHESELPWANS